MKRSFNWGSYYLFIMDTKKKRVIGLVGGICSKGGDGKVCESVARLFAPVL